MYSPEDDRDLKYKRPLKNKNKQFVIEYRMVSERTDQGWYKWKAYATAEQMQAALNILINKYKRINFRIRNTSADPDIPITDPSI